MQYEAKYLKTQQKLIALHHFKTHTHTQTQKQETKHSKACSFSAVAKLLSTKTKEVKQNNKNNNNNKNCSTKSSNSRGRAASLVNWTQFLVCCYWGKLENKKPYCRHFTFFHTRSHTYTCPQKQPSHKSMQQIFGNIKLNCEKPTFCMFFVGIYY